MIYKFIFSTVLSWIFFPIGLFKSGLSLWGYNQHPEAGRLTRLFNLGLGIFAGWLSLAFLAHKEASDYSYRSRNSEEYLDRVFSAEGWQTPIENYTEFYPWLLEQAVFRGYTAWQDATHLATQSIEIFGYTLSYWHIPALVVLAPFALFALVTEIHVNFVRIKLMFWRAKHKRYNKLRKAIRAEYEGDLLELPPEKFREYMDRLPEEPKMPNVDKAYGFITNWALDWKMRKYEWHLFRRTPYWMRDFVSFQYKVGDSIYFLEGMITPMVTAVFSILLFFPLLAVVGLWFLAAIMLLLGFAPFAMLYNNGYRVRMH